MTVAPALPNPSGNAPARSTGCALHRRRRPYEAKKRKISRRDGHLPVLKAVGK
jgi:hypothetical protein